MDDDGIIWDIEEEHLGEAEFLLLTRESLLDAADYTLDELAVGPDRRLLAHTDALAIAGPAVAERLLLATIEDEAAEPSFVAAATLALFVQADQRCCARVLAAVERVPLASQDAIVRGLELSQRPGLDAWLIHGLQEPSSGGRRVRLRALAGRRAPVGAWLLDCLDREDVEAMKAAAILARQNHAGELLTTLLRAADYDDPELGQLLLDAALCHHVAGAWEVMTQHAFRAEPSSARRHALTRIAQFGDAGVHLRMLELLEDPESRAVGLWALGFGGRPAAIDRAVELLADERHAALAAELICAIAGLSTDPGEHWRSDPAQHEESALLLEDDDLDANLLPRADEGLPIPESEAIAAWWRLHRADFNPALRYLDGQVLCGQGLLAALGHAPMRRRHALAFELEIRTAGASSVDTRALACAQRDQIAQLALPPNLDFQRGFTSPFHQPLQR